MTKIKILLKYKPGLTTNELTKGNEWEKLRIQASKYWKRG